MPHPAKRIQNLSPEAITELYLNEYATRCNSSEARGLLQAFGERAAGSGFTPDQTPAAQAQHQALAALFGIELKGVWRAETGPSPRLSPPSGLLLLPSGDLAVADDFNHRIQIYGPDMQLKQQFGSKGKNPGEFQYPKGMAVDTQGHLYVADSWNHRVQKFDPSGKHLQTFGGYGEGPGQLNEPYDVWVEAGGRLIVVERYNHRIQFFDPDGTSQGWLGSRATVFEEQLADLYETSNRLLPRPAFEFPTSLVADATGHFYLTDSGNHRVLKFDPEWNRVWSVGRQGGGWGEFQYPMCVTPGPGGRLYIADLNNDRIQVLTHEGVFVQAFAEADAKTPLKMPSTVLAAPDGRLWVGLTMNAALLGFQTPPLESGALYDHLAQVRPRSGAVRFGRGLHREQAGQPDAALEDYTEAARLWTQPVTTQEAGTESDDDRFARLSVRLYQQARSQISPDASDWMIPCLETWDTRIQQTREVMLQTFAGWAELLPRMLTQETEQQQRILENLEDPLTFNKELHELKKEDRALFQETRRGMFAYRRAVRHWLEYGHQLLQLSLDQDALARCMELVQVRFLGAADAILILLQEKERNEEMLVSALQDGQDNPGQWAQFVIRHGLNVKIMEQVPQLLVELESCLRLFDTASKRFPESPAVAAVLRAIALDAPAALKFPRLLLGLQEGIDLFHRLRGVLTGTMDTAFRLNSDTPPDPGNPEPDVFSPYRFDTELMEPADLLRSFRMAVCPLEIRAESVVLAGEAYPVSLVKGKEAERASQLRALLAYQQVYQQKTEELRAQLRALILQRPELEHRLQKVDVRDKATPIQIGNNLMVIGFQISLLYRMILTLGINETHNLSRLILLAALLRAAGKPEANEALDLIDQHRQAVRDRLSDLAAEWKTAGLHNAAADAQHAAWSQELDLEKVQEMEDAKMRLAESGFDYECKTAEVHRWARTWQLLEKAASPTNASPLAAPRPVFACSIGAYGWAPGGFLLPIGLGHLPDGSLLVADSNKQAVLRFSSDGVYQETWGHFGNGPGGLAQPYGLTVGPDQTVYVADFINRRVQAFGPDGRTLGAIGQRGDAHHRLGAVFDVDVDARGQVWVPDMEHHRVSVYSSAGEWLRSYGQPGSQPEDLRQPVSLCCLPDGGYVVGDQSEHLLKRFDAGGKLLATLDRGTLQVGETYFLIHAPEHGILAADSYHMQVLCLDLDLKPVWVVRNPGHGAGQMLRVAGLSVFGGRLFVTDFDNHRVQAFHLPGS